MGGSDANASSLSPKNKVTGYHGIPENQYGGKIENWKSINADFHTTEDGRGEVLEIDGHPVMEQWEHPYMAELARVATSHGGRVLEVGFGLGLSATAIQKFKIDEHVIIEANAGVIERAKKWAQDKPNKVTFMHGLWQDEVAKLEDKSLDGVLYDTYPLTKEEQHTHQFDFIRQIFPKLRPGAVLTYCNLTSIGVLRGQHEWKDLWHKTQVPHLRNIGFDKMSFSTVPVNPPEACEYYSHSEALLPTCLKRKLTVPVFKKLKVVDSYARGNNYHLKVKEIVEEEKRGKFAIIGDETGFVEMSLFDDQVEFMTSRVGKGITLRNTNIRDRKGFALIVDKWGKLEPNDTLDCEPNWEVDLGAAALEKAQKGYDYYNKRKQYKPKAKADEDKEEADK